MCLKLFSRLMVRFHIQELEFWTFSQDAGKSVKKMFRFRCCLAVFCPSLPRHISFWHPSIKHRLLRWRDQLSVMKIQLPHNHLLTNGKTKVWELLTNWLHFVTLMWYWCVWVINYMGRSYIFKFQQVKIT